jgi:hypothetical protein
MQLLESADGVVVYALDRVAKSLWDLAAVVRELETRGKFLYEYLERSGYSPSTPRCASS